MKKCVVKGCKITCYNKPPDISFFGFPKEPEMRKKWYDVLKKTENSIKKYTVICSKHFTPNDFLNSKSMKKRLLITATPSVNINTGDEVKPRKLKIKFDNVIETVEAPQKCETPITLTMKNEILDEVTRNEKITKSSAHNSELLEVDLTEEEEPPYVDLPDVESLDSESSMLARRLNVYSTSKYVGRISLKEAIKSTESVTSNSPLEIEKKLRVLRNAVKKKDLKIQALRVKVRRMGKKIILLEALIDHLQEKSLIRNLTINQFKKTQTTK